MTKPPVSAPNKADQMADDLRSRYGKGWRGLLIIVVLLVVAHLPDWVQLLKGAEQIPLALRKRQEGTAAASSPPPHVGTSGARGSLLAEPDLALEPRATPEMWWSLARTAAAGLGIWLLYRSLAKKHRAELAEAHTLKPIIVQSLAERDAAINRAEIAEKERDAARMSESALGGAVAQVTNERDQQKKRADSGWANYVATVEALNTETSKLLAAEATIRDLSEQLVRLPPIAVKHAALAECIEVWLEEARSYAHHGATPRPIKDWNRAFKVDAMRIVNGTGWATIQSHIDRSLQSRADDYERYWFLLQFEAPTSAEVSAEGFRDEIPR